MSFGSEAVAPQPEPAVAYSLQLGDSFMGARNCETYASLRYAFKPASLAGSGVYRQQGNKVSLHLPSSNVQFTGLFEQYKEDLECVAIFDGTSWRLELVSGHINAKFSRGAGGAGASMAATPELLSANTSCPSGSDFGIDQCASDDEVEGAGPRASSQPPTNTSRPQSRPNGLGQGKPSPGGSGQQAAAGKATGMKRSASEQALHAKAAAGKLGKVDEGLNGNGKPRSRLHTAAAPGNQAAAAVEHEKAPTPQEELDWDEAFEQFGEEEEEEEVVAPAPPLPVAQQHQPPQQHQQQARPPPPQQQQRRDAPAAPPVQAAARQPAPAPARPAAPAAAGVAPKVVPQPAAERAPAPTTSKPAAPAPSVPKPASKPASAAAPPWDFAGMDDDEEEEEEADQEADVPAVQQPAAEEEEEYMEEEEEEEEEEESAPVVRAPVHAAPAAVRPVQPVAYPTHHHMGDEEEEEDDDAHLRCTDDEASDGLGLEDGLC